MDLLGELDAGRRCERLIVGFWRCLDLNDYDGMLKRLHPEASWLRLGKLLRRRDEVLQALKARSRTLYIHHIVTNVQCDIAPDLQQAKFFCYLTVYRHNDGNVYEWPVPLAGPWTINVCTADLRLGADGWLISYLSNTPSFSADVKPR